MTVILPPARRSRAAGIGMLMLRWVCWLIVGLIVTAALVLGLNAVFVVSHGL